MLKSEERYAVFLDIDGTLISDSFKIPERNKKAIAAAREKGHMVFINTGRSWGNIPPDFLNQIELDGVIAGSGAMIHISGKTHFKRSMNCDLIKRIMEYAFNHREYSMIFEGEKNVYILPNEIRQRRGYQKEIKCFEDYLKICSEDEIQVIAMGQTVPDDFKELFKDELTVFQFETYADLVVKGLNKAVGIQKVLELTGIRKENTVAIGDSNNDYDMIKFAGIGVAMANSQQRILDIADMVTDSAENCGVAKAIERILL